MIRILKPAAPTVLATHGAEATAADRAAYDRGQRSFRFRRRVYAHPTVRAALRAAQHDKCAFCESKFGHVDFGDVEHFRPKGGFRQREGGRLVRPGYFWLAYDWANLLASCTLCNQQFKRNHFPVRVQRDRPRSHHDDPTRERPLLIDPGVDRPERFLTFVGGSAVPVRRSRRGEAAIRLLGLNRQELIDRRVDRHDLLAELREACNLLLARDPRHRTPAEHEWLVRNQPRLAAAVRPDAEYAAMARVVLG